ncbi:MAG: pentachlorophenol monooxygenase [Rubrivivax sp.]|nr:MAG: pentachlorophenol monooxygenase [Rubrivivax sp.]
MHSAQTASPTATAGDPDADVLVVGAGPTGLTLAAALASKGLRALVVDGQAAGDNTSRAAVVHAHTLEALQALDVSPRLVRIGLPVGRFTVRDCDRILMPITFDHLPTAYPYALMVSQAVTERILRARLAELGGQVRRPCRLTGLAQDDGGVNARLDDGSSLRARFLVGADGMHSTVREQTGIGFSGGRYEESFVLADVQLSAGVPADEVILYLSPAGMVVTAPLPGGLHRVVATVEQAPQQPELADIQALLDERGPQRHRPRVQALDWSSRFRIHHRVADTYRAGRVLLAGDAAHVHSPAGGQGMNTGMLDAMRLAEALTEALNGDLHALDRYEAERRPVAQQVVRLADRLTRLATVPSALRPVRNLAVAAAAQIPAVRRQLAWRLSGLIHR